MMLLALGVLLSPTFSSEVLHDVLRYSVDYLTLFFSVLSMWVLCYICNLSESCTHIDIFSGGGLAMRCHSCEQLITTHHILVIAFTTCVFL